MVCPAVTFPTDAARHITSLGKMQACLRGIVVVFECLLPWLDVSNPYWGSIQNPHLWCDFFAGPGQILLSTFDPPRLRSTKVPARSHMARIRMVFFWLVAAISLTSHCNFKECQELDLCFNNYNIQFQLTVNEDNSCSHSWFFSLRHGVAFRL